jgi:hypothetical protein
MTIKKHLNYIFNIHQNILIKMPLQSEPRRFLGVLKIGRFFIGGQNLDFNSFSSKI